MEDICEGDRNTRLVVFIEAMGLKFGSRFSSS